MVSAPRMLKEKRQMEINLLTSSIQKAIETNQNITREKIIISAMANLNVSRRTASDYADIIIFKLNLEIEDGRNRKTTA